MKINKIVLVPVFLLVVIGLVGLGFFLGRQNKNLKSANYKAPSNAAVTQTSDLAPPSGNSLSVSSSGANLGQLTSPQSQIPTTSPSANPGSSSQNSTQINPSTFNQYEKYKTNNSSLFGDIQVGTGPTLGANQKATITYKGWLTNGSLFDQSSTNSQGQLLPLVFTIGGHQVITGMEEGVYGMKVGGSRLIIIPPTLGYGTSGQGSIPPNAVLVFEVNLVDVK